MNNHAHNVLEKLHVDQRPEAAAHVLGLDLLIIAAAAAAAAGIGFSLRRAAR